MRRKKGYFSISAVAQMLSIHQQTIRMYEKEGLIQPKRSDGNTRLFSEEDIEQLEEIIHLTHTVGINLAGVHMVLRLQKQLAKLQKEVNTLFGELHKELSLQAETSDAELKNQMARFAQLAKKKRPQKNTTISLADNYTKE